MKKNGFTLIELLAVIAIMGILIVLVVPNYIGTTKKSNDKVMINKESTFASSAELYVTDYCLEPLFGAICPTTFNTTTYSGYVCINDVVAEGYSDTPIYGKDTMCNGYVDIKNNIFKTYLKCGTDYTTDGYVEKGC